MDGEMKHVSTKSLECPMCMNIFKEPKFLSCSHTFCKACLERLLKCHENSQFIKCPVCRVVNQIPSRDVSQLPTNVALQPILEDVTKEYQSCTDCNGKGKNEEAKSHCQGCRKYFCLDCRKIHDSSGFHHHEVLPLNEISKGKAPSQQRRKCRQHPDKEDECFCRDCSKYVCIRCGVTEHAYIGHQIIDASLQESNQKKTVDELKSKVNKQKSSLQKYITIIDKQESETSIVKKQCIDEINQAYDESIRELAVRKNILIHKVTGRIKKLETELLSLKQNAQQQNNEVTNMIDLVSNENQVLLEMDALAAHVTLREDLQNVLRKQNLDYEYPVKLGSKGKQIAFNKNVNIKDISLGCIIEKESSSPTEKGMNTRAVTADGMMAVGTFLGGYQAVAAPRGTWGEFAPAQSEAWPTNNFWS